MPKFLHDTPCKRVFNVNHEFHPPVSIVGKPAGEIADTRHRGEVALKGIEYGVVAHHAEENIAETDCRDWMDSGRINEQFAIYRLTAPNLGACHLALAINVADQFTLEGVILPTKL